MRGVRLFGLGTLIVLAFACGEDDATPTSGTGGSADGGAAGDGASVSDGAAAADGGAPGDGGVTPGADAGPLPEAGPFDAGPAPACADANVRCVPQEYATIQAAAAATAPGDVVYVAAGTYKGFNVSTSGTAAKPIVYRAAGPTTVINAGSDTNDDGVRLQNVSYVTIVGFTVDATAMTGRCVAARGATAVAPMHGNIVANVKCSHAAHEGFYLSQFADGLVEGNTIESSGRDGTPRGHGLYLANGGSDNTIVRANRISGTGPLDSAGIHLNGDLSIGGDGIIQNVVIERNVISGNNHNGINADGVQNAVVVGNLVTGNARSGLRAYKIDGAAGPKGFVVANNTFSGNVAWAIKMSEDGGGHVVFDNIALGGTGSLCVGGSVTSDRNVFAGPLSNDEESTTIALAAWRSATGQDAASLTSTAAALFVGPADFHLLAAAPARNAGIGALGGKSAATVDLDGTARPKGAAIDIGAYEFVE